MTRIIKARRATRLYSLPSITCQEFGNPVERGKTLKVLDVIRHGKHGLVKVRTTEGEPWIQIKDWISTDGTQALRTPDSRTEETSE